MASRERQTTSSRNPTNKAGAEPASKDISRPAGAAPADAQAAQSAHSQGAYAHTKADAHAPGAYTHSKNELITAAALDACVAAIRAHFEHGGGAASLTIGKRTINIRAADAQARISCGGGLQCILTRSGRATFYARLPSLEAARKMKLERLGEYAPNRLTLAAARAEVAKRLKTVHEQRAASKHQQQAPHHLGDELIKWIEHVYKGYGRTMARYTNFKSTAKRLSPLYGLDLASLTPGGVREALLRDPAKSPNMRYEELQLLRQFFDHAVIMGWMPDNVARKITTRGPDGKPFNARSLREHRKYVNLDDLAAVLLTKMDAWCIRDQVVVLYLTLSAARLNEGLCLKWEYVRWEDGFIELPFIKQTTAENQRRHRVPLTPHLRALLLGWRATGASGAVHVFPRRDGDAAPMSSSTLQTSVKAVTGGQMSLHGLRSTFSTFMHGQHKDSYGDKVEIERLLSHLPPTITAAQDAYDKSGDSLESMAHRTRLLAEYDEAVFQVLPPFLRELCDPAGIDVQAVPA